MGQVSYSIYSGVTYQADSIFSTLGEGTYYAEVTDQSDFTVAFISNPEYVNANTIDTPILVNHGDTLSAGFFQS